MPSMISMLVADLQRHVASEARYNDMTAGQRYLSEQGQRRQSEIAEYILSRPAPVTAKQVAEYLGVTDECIRKHAVELAAAKKIVKLSGYPARYWWKSH